MRILMFIISGSIVLVSKLVKAIWRNPYFFIGILLLGYVGSVPNLDPPKVVIALLISALLMLLDGMHSIEKAITKTTDIQKTIARQQFLLLLQNAGELDNDTKAILAELVPTTNKSTKRPEDTIEPSQEAKQSND